MKTVTIETTVEKNIDLVWKYWTSPEHITHWNFASLEWHCPSAEHDLKEGGRLKYHMAAKDGSMAFDYTGTFLRISEPNLLEYALDDGRKVSIKFQEENASTRVIESFEVEDENSIDLQKQGWQAILNNFKKHAESL